jgi:serine/threonine protein kinase
MWKINIEDYLPNQGFEYLGQGANNECFSNDFVVAKAFLAANLGGWGRTKKAAYLEGKQMALANAVNPLAVKLLKVGSISHPNGSPPWEVDFIFMEKLTPMSLEEIAAISLEDRRAMLEPVWDYLDQLHNHQIYHGDINNPTGEFNNVIVTSKGIRLIDWGVSKDITPDLDRRAIYQDRKRDMNALNKFSAYFYSI